MNIEVDQFGRNTNQSNTNNNNNEDKNKKILESLSEIKEQLQNKNFSPKSDPPINLSNKISKNSDFEELNQRLINLERSLIDINDKLKTKSDNYQDIRRRVYSEGIDLLSEWVEKIHLSNDFDESLKGEVKSNGTYYKPIPIDLLLEVKQKVLEGNYKYQILDNQI